MFLVSSSIIFVDIVGTRWKSHIKWELPLPASKWTSRYGSYICSIQYISSRNHQCRNIKLRRNYPYIYYYIRSIILYIYYPFIPSTTNNADGDEALQGEQPLNDTAKLTKLQPNDPASTALPASALLQRLVALSGKAIGWESNPTSPCCAVCSRINDSSPVKVFYYIIPVLLLLYTLFSSRPELEESRDSHRARKTHSRYNVQRENFTRNEYHRTSSMISSTYLASVDRRRFRMPLKYSSQLHTWTERQEIYYVPLFPHLLIPNQRKSRKRYSVPTVASWCIIKTTHTYKTPGVNIYISCPSAVPNLQTAKIPKMSWQSAANKHSNTLSVTKTAKSLHK